MNNYAPEYTKRERIIIITKYIACTIPLILVLQFWFFPWFNNYVNKAHCYEYGAFTGTHLVFYGVFIALPLLFAITLFAVEGKRSIKIIKLGQAPLPHEKVFKPTKYTYGLKARAKPILFFCVFFCLIGLAIMGWRSANNNIQTLKQNDFSFCEKTDSATLKKQGLK